MSLVKEAAVRSFIPSSGFFHDYIEYGSNCTDCHLSYHLLGGLQLLAALSPVNFTSKLGGRPIHMNIFGLLVGNSTKARKTTAMVLARQILQQVDAAAVGETPGSVEGLIESLRTRNQQLVMYEEFGDFLARSKTGYMESMKTTYMNMYDCSPIGNALSKKRKGLILQPRLSIFAGCDPTLIEEHTASVDWTGGFLARFLTIYAEKERSYAIPPGDETGEADLIRQLHAMKNRPEIVPYKGMDPMAAELWTAYSQELETTTVSRDIQAAYARSNVMALKIASLLSYDCGQASDSRTTWQITEREMAPAIEIAKIHCESVKEISKSLTGSRDMRDRKVVLDLIKMEGSGPPTPDFILMRDAKLIKKRVLELIDTLLAEKIIVRVRGNRFYQIPPERAIEEDRLKLEQEAISDRNDFGSEIEFTAETLDSNDPIFMN